MRDQSLQPRPFGLQDQGTRDMDSIEATKGGIGQRGRRLPYDRVNFEEVEARHDRRNTRQRLRCTPSHGAGHLDRGEG